VKSLALPVFALLSTAAAAQDGTRTLPEAVDAAVDLCVASAFNSEATLDGRIAIFTYAEGRYAAVLQQRGLYTTAQLPELMQRFVTTSRYSRQFGHRDVVAIAATDGMVWLVQTGDSHHCDIAITGVEAAGSIPAAVSQGITGNEGWSQVDSTTIGPLWSANFVLGSGNAGANSANATIAATGLVEGSADADGIQSEINFAAVDIGSTPQQQ
jgi:hypothetical protein